VADRHLKSRGEYWVRYGKEEGHKEAVRSFSSLDWLNEESFGDEDKLHAQAMRDAISHARGIGLKLNLKVSKLEQKDREQP